MKILILVLSITDDDFIDDVIGDVIDDVVWSRNVIQEPSLYTTDLDGLSYATDCVVIKVQTLT